MSTGRGALFFEAFLVHSASGAEMQDNAPSFGSVVPIGWDKPRAMTPHLENLPPPFVCLYRSFRPGLCSLVIEVCHADEYQ